MSTVADTRPMGGGITPRNHALREAAPNWLRRHSTSGDPKRICRTPAKRDTRAYFELFRRFSAGGKKVQLPRPTLWSPTDLTSVPYLIRHIILTIQNPVSNPRMMRNHDASQHLWLRTVPDGQDPRCPCVSSGFLNPHHARVPHPMSGIWTTRPHVPDNGLLTSFRCSQPMGGCCDVTTGRQCSR
ncbi:hypothetical protein CEXT_3061 [Caerostris extrusa]|uniref:Uncharacterized protein n=1 Tax=Caerostris extrusa TaxID=172846 RepID=A0AAV4VM08_CAEEX|nr:hypothetical protein CEXT_3061 [Caerostris extrusa]